MGFAEGSYIASTEESVDLGHGYERVFDPLWTNARTFLDHLSENDLIEGDLGIANIGQFVLVKGFLTILDLTMMKSAWQLNSVKTQIKKGMGGSIGPSVTAAQKAKQKDQRENAEFIIDLMQIMPHAVNATLLTREGDAYLAWCALREEFMSTPASEILMTHGGTLQGDWTLVGVLNALPDMTGVNGLNNQQQNDGEIGMMDSIVGRVSGMLSPMVRVGLGRPARAYAITPLLIFREVT